MIGTIILIGLFGGSCQHNPEIHMKDNKMCSYVCVGGFNVKMYTPYTTVVIASGKYVIKHQKTNFLPFSPKDAKKTMLASHI